MRPSAYIAGVFGLLCLCSCTTLLTYTPDEHATKFVHGTIKKCGEVEPDKRSELIEKCIFDSLNSGEPFYAWFWLRPIDSVPAAGLILNQNNELFITWYDSGYLWWGSIFNAAKCKSWSVYVTDSEQKILCTMPESEKAYLFNMEHFVSIEKQ